jgi:hypothetical protein
MTKEITKDDILKVAYVVKIRLTEEQVEEVLNMYDIEAANDLTATWELIVEQCLYKIIEE